MNIQVKQGSDWRILDALLVSLGHLGEAMSTHRDLRAQLEPLFMTYVVN